MTIDFNFDLMARKAARMTPAQLAKLDEFLWPGDDRLDPDAWSYPGGPLPMTVIFGKENRNRTLSGYYALHGRLPKRWMVLEFVGPNYRERAASENNEQSLSEFLASV
jgi:hypothetical protein